MKLVILAIYLIIESGLAHNQKGHNGLAKTSERNYKTYLDIFKEDLLSYDWVEDEKPCLDQILRTVDNVKNTTLWATWIWDSIQLPVGQFYGSKYHFGNYDQCLKGTVGSSSPPFQTQYCLTNVALGSDGQTRVSPNDIDPYDSSESYIHSRTKLKQRFNVLTWGLCVPQSCRAKSIQTFARALLKQSHLGYTHSPVEITVEDCEAGGVANKSVDGFYFVLAAVLVMAAIALACTMCTSEQHASNSLATKVIKCFCLKRNTKAFLKTNDDDVKVLHGIRFFACCIVVYEHILMAMVVVTAGNGLDFEQFILGVGSKLWQYAMIVDTFYLISGFLLTKTLKNNTLENHVKIILKRYFRLIWWYIAAVLILMFILPSRGCGPICAKAIKLEQETCSKNWWIGLLMLGNYIDSPNICLPNTWYIYSDFQLTVAATVLFWLYGRYPRTAKVFSVTLAALSFILPAINIYNSPHILHCQFDVEIYNLFRLPSNLDFIESYEQTEYRSIPYVIGLILGYNLFSNGGKRFTHTAVKTLLSIAVLSSAATLITLSLPISTNLKSALIMVLCRLVWAFVHCAFIGICVNRYFAYISDFLSWSIFGPLSKLTYGVYMINFVTISYNVFSARSPIYFNGYVLTEKLFGNMALDCCLSLLFMLLIESPLNNLVNLILHSGSKTEYNVKVKDSEVVDGNTGVVHRTDLPTLQKKVL